MDQQAVVTLMASSRNEAEWNQNADTVKRECGGYPDFWWPAIMASGLAHEVRQTWASTIAERVFPKPNPHMEDGVMVFTLEPPLPPKKD